MKTKYDWVDILGLAYLISCCIVYTYLLGYAYFNDGIVRLDFNRYGENLLEVVVSAFLLPFTIFFIYRYVSARRRGDIEYEKK